MLSTSTFVGIRGSATGIGSADSCPGMGSGVDVAPALCAARAASWGGKPAEPSPGTMGITEMPGRVGASMLSPGIPAIPGSAGIPGTTGTPGVADNPGRPGRPGSPRRGSGENGYGN